MEIMKFEVISQFILKELRYSGKIEQSLLEARCEMRARGELANVRFELLHGRGLIESDKEKVMHHYLERNNLDMEEVNFDNVVKDVMAYLCQIVIPENIRTGEIVLEVNKTDKSIYYPELRLREQPS